MMMTINVNFQGRVAVELTASPVLAELLKLVKLETPTNAAETLKEPVKVVQAVIAPEEPEEAPQAPVQEPEQKPVTKSHVRAEMDKTYARLQAEEGGENYDKYRKGIMNTFFTICQSMGVDKPSQLKTDADRQNFIEAIQNIQIVDGVLTIKAPF